MSVLAKIFSLLSQLGMVFWAQTCVTDTLWTGKCLMPTLWLKRQINNYDEPECSAVSDVYESALKIAGLFKSIEWIRLDPVFPQKSFYYYNVNCLKSS